MELYTVGDMIRELSKFPENTEITGTYEGITEFISDIYAAQGILLIDIDGSFYKEDFQSGSYKI